MMWSSRLGKHPLSLTARVMAFVALAIGLSLLVIGYLVDNAVKRHFAEHLSAPVRLAYSPISRYSNGTGPSALIPHADRARF